MEVRLLKAGLHRGGIENMTSDSLAEGWTRNGKAVD